MKVLLIHNVEPEDVGFNDPLKSHVSEMATIEEVNYRDADDWLENNSVQGVIISGAPLSYSYSVIDDRLPYMQWLKKCEVPVLGICLGHQNIARLYGADLIKAHESENTPQELMQNESSLLFDGIESGEKVVERHRGSVTLPEGFVQLASSARCKNQVMRHCEKEIYGVQFHPELSEVGVRMLRNFVGSL